MGITSRVFRQSFPAANLSLERATENVPDDGCFHLLIDGVIVKSFRSEKAAQTEYRALREAYLGQHPIEQAKVDFNEMVREDQNRLSNKGLIWEPEDFVRVERATKRRQ